MAMLTKLTVRNFKNLGDVEIELGNPVIFIGPNNSGKTTALQALALWEIGLRRWNEKRADQSRKPEKRSGVAINRRDLISVPVPYANLLWRNLRVREASKVSGKPQTENIRIEVEVEGVSENKNWRCGLEFDYANEESFYCRPLRIGKGKSGERMAVPAEAAGVRVAFLHPMSGLSANETRLDPGAIQVRLGEGRTAEVLRNLCYRLYTEDASNGFWETLCERIQDLFGATLNAPVYVEERGEITMTYQERSGVKLDLSASGRGLQQTMLLLAYLAANRGSVLLLDEPDAHLEILRQRQIYQELSRWAIEHGSQIIAASHSEILLNEAAVRDVVIAFLGKPHRIDDRGSQLIKSLRTIGYDQYYQAEQTGWVLYLEGSTDLAILRAFAEILEHEEAREILRSPFVHYVANQPAKAEAHFFGLKEAKSDLVGFALFDRLPTRLEDRPNLEKYMWKRQEIENHLCTRESLLQWAALEGEKQGGEMFAAGWRARMDNCIDRIESSLRTLRRPSPWSPDIKITDEFLDPLFDEFFKELNLPNLMRKTDYHVLAARLTKDQIDPEVRDVLDSIVQVQKKAKPAQ
jgi:predicted ATPase